MMCECIQQRFGTRKFVSAVKFTTLFKTADKTYETVRTSYSLYYIYVYNQIAEQNIHCPRVIKKTLKRHVDFSQKHSICNLKLMNLILFFYAIRE